MQNPCLQALARIAALARRRGVTFAWQAARWKARTALSKRYIALQDRLGLYPYARWIAAFEARQPPEALPETAPPLLFSVLVSSPFDAALPATVGALLDQAYPHWEALAVCSVAADGASGWPSGQDRRFRPLAESATGYGAAIRAARGDFVLVLHAGDTLSAAFLTQAARALAQEPQPGILYSDEDRLLPAGGARHAPFFKPAWSPELLLSVNYLSHALIHRPLLLQALDEGNNADIDPRVEGEAVYADLIYRCAERAGRLHHLPGMLVHCASPRLPAEQLCGVVQRHVQRSGLPAAQATLTGSGQVRVSWHVEERPVSIIIPTLDHAALLGNCLTSIRQVTRYTDYEILLVDSGSREPETLRYYQELRSQANLRIIPYTPEGAFNFSAALNLGAKHARGEIFVFLNNDTQAIDPDWLEELVRWASRPEIGIAGAMLLFPGGDIQHAGIVLGLEGHASHVFGGARPGSSGPFGAPGWYRNYSAVTGACLAMRRQVFEQVGGFDEGYQLVFSDIEIGLRAWRAGYRVVYTPFARLLHHEGRTRYRYMPAQDLQRGLEHFREIVERGDPFYNSNLSSALRIPTLRRPDEETPLQRLQKIVKYTL